MKLKIAVTDACIFIDLYDLNLIAEFFNLEIEAHTTSTVLFELFDTQQEILKAYQSVNKLTVHNLQETDFTEIYSGAYPNSLSEADKSVLHIANRLDACVLSSDKTLRNCAKNKGIEYHGMLWIFDRFVEHGILSHPSAATKLKQLIDTNSIYMSNRQLALEIEKRIKEWEA